MSSKIFPHTPRLDRFTSLGGYPLFYVVEGDPYRRAGDLAVLCCECATEETREAHACGTHRDLKVTPDVNWEDPDMYCEGCNARIESAYGEE